MNKSFMRVFTKIHVWFYRATKGKSGSDMKGMKILLLTNVGKRSGTVYTTPLAYFMDGKNYAIVASAGGTPKHPGWYHNLMASPKTTIQVMDRTINVKAKQAPKRKRDDLWKDITSAAPDFQDYQDKTDRIIPVVLLTPQK